MRSHAYQERRTGWRALFDPDMWSRAVLVATIGVVSLAALASAVALARDTTGHDWHATRKLTVAELLIWMGFDENVPTEYRTWRGEVLTLTRDGLTSNGDALVARGYLLRTARKAAELGACCGFGGALLCLALIRRPRDERRVGHPVHESTPGHRLKSHDRLASTREMPMSAPSAVRPVPSSRSSLLSTPVPALTDQEPAPEPPRPAKPESAATGQGKPDTAKDNEAEPARRGRRKRDHGRWV